MMMTGSVSSDRTRPPTSGAERGSAAQLMNTAKPSNPNTIDGTAARLLMLTSIRSDQRLRGANSSRYIAAATPMGNASKTVTTSM